MIVFSSFFPNPSAELIIQQTESKEDEEQVAILL